MVVIPLIYEFDSLCWSEGGALSPAMHLLVSFGIQMFDNGLEFSHTSITANIGTTMIA